MIKSTRWHAPCETSNSINPHGSLLLWVPTNLKDGVGGTSLPHKGRSNSLLVSCKNSLQCDRRSDWLFGLWVGAHNIGCLCDRRSDWLFGLWVGAHNIGCLCGNGGNSYDEEEDD